MKHWTIKAFQTASEKNLIKKWLKKQPIGAQAYIDRRLRYLETQKIWERPHAAKRKGSKDIYEIIIKWNKNQYRPLGFFNPNQKEFILLIGAKEKNWRLQPRDADKTAEARRKLVMKDRKYIGRYFE